VPPAGGLGIGTTVVVSVCSYETADGYADFHAAEHELDAAGPVLNVDKPEQTRVSRKDDEASGTDFGAGYFSLPLVLEPAAEIEVGLCVERGFRLIEWSAFCAALTANPAISRRLRPCFKSRRRHF
jgi:hypothetical protein